MFKEYDTENNSKFSIVKLVFKILLYEKMGHGNFNKSL